MNHQPVDHERELADGDRVGGPGLVLDVAAPGSESSVAIAMTSCETLVPVAIDGIETDRATASGWARAA
jgi:hypothetical protein